MNKYHVCNNENHENFMYIIVTFYICLREPCFMCAHDAQVMSSTVVDSLWVGAAEAEEADLKGKEPPPRSRRRRTEIKRKKGRLC